MRIYVLFAVGLIAAAFANSAAVHAQQSPTRRRRRNQFQAPRNNHRLRRCDQGRSRAGMKKMGFASIINLRQDSEPGANVEAEAAAAKSVGAWFIITFHLMPKARSGSRRQFLDAITAKGSDPAFIHCAGGNRAATMWMIKRLAVDHWVSIALPRKPPSWA